MANLPFSAPDLLFDLRINIEKIRQKHDRGPADVNALLYGVIDAFSVGKTSMSKKVFTDYGSEIVVLLTAYKELSDRSITKLVENINSRVYFGQILTEDNFASVATYGTSNSAEYYRMGFEMALSWVFKLYNSAISNSIDSERSRSLALMSIEYLNVRIASDL